MTEENGVNEYEVLLSDLLKQLDRLPSFLRIKVEKDLKELLNLLRDQRPPRFMLVGRRGTGKSSLINAIFNEKVMEIGSVKSETGKAIWKNYKKDDKIIELLDTRGLQEGSKPKQSDDALNSKESILNAVKEKCPDAVLFLCKAKEVDSAIETDLEEFEELLRNIEKIHKRQLPIVGIITQCDELDPADIRKPAEYDEEKQKNIDDSVKVITDHLTSRNYIKQNFVRVIPTCAYVRYRTDGTIDVNRDYRWNIEELVRILFEELPLEAKVNFARIAKIKDFQKKISFKLVHICATICGVIGAEPLPVADLPVLIAIQAVMIVFIAYISGCKLSLMSVKKFLASLGVDIGGGLILREISRGLIKLIPGFGSYVSGGVAFIGTEAVGYAAIAYFIDNKEMDYVKRLFAEKLKGK